MKKILILNGPNLNMLGTREPTHYGQSTLADVQSRCQAHGQALGYAVECLQSNWEGALIDALHQYGQLHHSGQALGVVFNPGALTHTSIALHDAIKAVQPLPVVECHISNVHARESFRHHSWVSPVAAGLVIGFGVDGYLIAIDALVRRFASNPSKE